MSLRNVLFGALLAGYKVPGGVLSYAPEKRMFQKAKEKETKNQRYMRIRREMREAQLVQGR